MKQKHPSPDVPVASTESVPSGLAELHALHMLEVVELGSCIREILEDRTAESQRADVNAVLVPRLREANQNLLLASFGAQDRQALAEAENLRQTKFLTMLAHELRSPLHPIMMASGLIGNIAEAHPDLPMLHGIIDRQLAHLIRLVDDLLDASRASAGKIFIQTSVISLRIIVESAMETAQPVIDSRQQHLELDYPAQAVFIDGDLVRLTQVFSNLLLNASKYTPEFGHVLIRVTPGPQQVDVAVIDDGAGVPLDIQPLIFDMFVQGPRPSGPALHGLGIGLSLVRTITELHRGTVRMHSAGEGEGSEFVVTLPLAELPHPPA